MRPKKNILCVDADSVALSHLKFILETRGYRVLTEDVRASAEILLEDKLPHGMQAPGHPYYDVVIWAIDKRDGAELMQAIERCKGETRVIMTSRDVSEYPAWMRADRFLPVLGNEAQWTLVLLDTIKSLCARKRGPKRMVA